MSRQPQETDTPPGEVRHPRRVFVCGVRREKSWRRRLARSGSCGFCFQPSSPASLGSNVSPTITFTFAGEQAAFVLKTLLGAVTWSPDCRTMASGASACGLVSRARCAFSHGPWTDSHALNPSPRRLSAFRLAGTLTASPWAHPRVGAEAWARPQMEPGMGCDGRRGGEPSPLFIPLFERAPF